MVGGRGEQLLNLLWLECILKIQKNGVILKRHVDVSVDCLNYFTGVYKKSKYTLPFFYFAMYIF